MGIILGGMILWSSWKSRLTGFLNFLTDAPCHSRGSFIPARDASNGLSNSHRDWRELIRPSDYIPSSTNCVDVLFKMGPPVSNRGARRYGKRFLSWETAVVGNPGCSMRYTVVLL